LNNNNQVVIGNQTINTSVTTGVTSTSISGSQSITGSLNVSGSILVDGSLINGSSIVTTNGTTIVQTDTTGSYNSAFYKYSISNGGNARAGEVTAVWNGSNIVYEEYSTTDIGSTTDLTFNVTLSGTNVRLNASSTGGWTVKTYTTLM